MRRCAAALLCALAVPAAAEEQLTDTGAFERAYAESFYRFDACGDALTGVMYRRALGRKFAACPFDDAAKARFEQRTAAQEDKSEKMIRQMIDAHGGLPMKLDGMTRTCREQIDSPEYQALRTGLEQEKGGQVPLATVLPQPCDADGL